MIFSAIPAPQFTSSLTAYPIQSNQVLQDTRALSQQVSLFTQSANYPPPSTLAAVASTFSPTQTSSNLIYNNSFSTLTNPSIFGSQAPLFSSSTSSFGGGGFGSQSGRGNSNPR